MPDGEQTSGGLVHSLRRLLETSLCIIKNRLELLAVELQEEKGRLVAVLAWAAAAIFCSVIAIIMVTLTIVYLFWEEARIFVLAGFSVLYLAGAGIAAFYLKTLLKDRPPPLSDSVAEIKKDVAWLKGEK